MTNTHLPRNSEIVRVLKSKSARDIKPFLELALDDDGVVAKCEPYLTNGGVEGHKLYDLAAVADIIIKFDAAHGNNIFNKHLNKMEVVNQLKVVLRRRYELDKFCKVMGINPKFGNLLSAPKIEAPAT